jgi:hypothetical protein
MTILTDISKPELVKVVAVRCDRCGTETKFTIDHPSDLIILMNAEHWSVPVEGKPDFCPDCAIRITLR